MVAVDLEGLRGALRLICPDVDWSWLLKIAKRIAATATRIHQKYHMVTSERLYALGVELMDHAAEAADAHERMSLTHALEFRDGLVIAFLALIPLRSRTLTALRVGRQLVKTGDLWALDIPATDTKSGRPLDYPIAIELSWRIDLYLERFRCVIHGAGRHTSPWASISGASNVCHGDLLSCMRPDQESFRISRHSSSISACSRELMVYPRPKERARR